MYASWIYQLFVIVTSAMLVLPTICACSETEEEISTTLEFVKPCIVRILTYDKQGKGAYEGSGFFVNKEGNVVTNWHVAKRPLTILVQTVDGNLYGVKEVLAKDEEGDLALLSVDIPGQRTPYLSLSSSPPDVGDTVTSYRICSEQDGFVSYGIVSTTTEVPAFGNMIGTTQRLSSGWSGSAVINMKGEVVGVVLSTYTGLHDLTILTPASRVARLPSAGTLNPVNWETNRWTAGPVSAEDFFLVGLALRWYKHWTEDALVYFEQALDRDPGHMEACLQMAYCNDHLGYRTAQVEAFKQAIRINSKSFKAHYNLGLAYGILRRYSEAVEAFRDAIDISPAIAEGHRELGWAYRRLGRYGEAIEAYKKVIDIDPDDAKAFYDLGMVYKEMDCPGQAIEAFGEAVRVDPDYAEAYHSLGLTCDGSGRHIEATEAYLNAIQIDPGRSETHLALALAYGELGLYDDMVRFLQEAIRLDLPAPLAPHVHNLLGSTFADFGEIWSAVQEYQILKQIDQSLADELHEHIYECR